ncbi:ATP-binding protein [Candidatus Dependentiae bacterium]
MFFRREMIDALKKTSKFPVVGVFGPRQSGKTTLVKHTFPKHKYLNFEDLNLREFASENPSTFFSQYENEHGIIIDEFQHVPEILSYVQMESDAKDRPGYFVLTGSQNFLMNQAITQSLAGRIKILTLLPFSLCELEENHLLHGNVDKAIFSGGYPRLYAKNIDPADLFPSYIQSYVERDVRQIINVQNLSTFQKFIQLCAGRVGQILNIAALSNDCGVSQSTTKQWLSLLEASYVIFLLKPYHSNFNKRVTKSPKLFFFDTGLACSLLKIRSSSEISLSPHRGHLFECLIISDIIKQYFNSGMPSPTYFWRDLNGRVEVDCLVDLGTKLVPIEIKSGSAVSKNYFENLKRWYSVAQDKTEKGYVVYSGEIGHRYEYGELLGWHAAGKLTLALDMAAHP